MDAPIAQFNLAVIDDGNMASTITSADIDVRETKTGAMQAVYTGAPVGNLYIQASNDIVNLGYTNIYTFAISAAGSTFQNLPDIGAQYYRIQYVPTSGSGNLDVTVNGKRI